MPPDPIRIRAVPPWTPAHGAEAPFLPLSAEERVELRRLGNAITFKTAGSQIYEHNDEASFLYLLTDGVVEADRTFPNGERQIVAFFWPGDVLGLAEEGVYVNSAAALTPCTVYRFPIDKLSKFLIEHPLLQLKFLVKSINDLRNTQRQLLMMGRLNVLKRLAAFLLDCSAHETYFDAKRRVLTLPMTRYDVADYIGASAEGVIRGFGRLEALGLLNRLSPRTLKLKTAELKAFVDLADH